MIEPGSSDSRRPAIALARDDHDRSTSSEFVSLFLADQRRIHRFIVTLLGSQQDADDLLQETAMVLWRKLGEFQRGTNFFSWACKTAHLLVLEHRRHKGREAMLLDEDVLEMIAQLAAGEDSVRDVRAAALEHCLGKLTADDRRLVERSYLDRLTGREIALELERPEKSIHRSLGRIRRGLMECVRRLLASAERGEAW